jgi:hypothetical protein
MVGIDISVIGGSINIWRLRFLPAHALFDNIWLQRIFLVNT